MQKANSIEEYLDNNSHFAESLQLLRQIINSTELVETLKWNAPVYTLKGKNIIGLGAFKNHFCIWFFNGVFLKDEKNLLVNAHEKTKGLRQMRFKNKADIEKTIVLSYVVEAIENQKQNKKLQPERQGKTVTVPARLIDAFKADELFKEHFYTLTSGRQREYAEYIESAKRDTTKESRMEKIKLMIMNGIGLHDKYRDC